MMFLAIPRKSPNMTGSAMPEFRAWEAVLDLAILKTSLVILGTSLEISLAVEGDSATLGDLAQGR